MSRVAVELTPQHEAAEIAALAAAVLCQQELLALLVAARCDRAEIYESMEVDWHA